MKNENAAITNQFAQYGVEMKSEKLLDNRLRIEVDIEESQKDLKSKKQTIEKNITTIIRGICGFKKEFDSTKNFLE